MKLGDFYVMRIDERHAWTGDVAEKCDAILTAYFFDRSKHVHACELTPSFEAWTIGHEAHPREGLSEREADAVHEAVMSVHDDSIRYFHVSFVERMLAEHPERFTHVGAVDVDDETDPDDRDREIDSFFQEGWATGALR